MIVLLDTDVTHLAKDPDRERARVESLLAAPLAVLPFDEPAARVCARLDSALRAQRIGPQDLMTASIAVVHRLTLATRNVREFARVPGLQIEDWSDSV